MTPDRASPSPTAATPRRVDLTRATFLIPLKFDSLERVRNLLVALRVLTRYADTAIRLVETGRRPSFEPHLRGLGRAVRYAFLPDDAPFFHRTRLLNRMVLEAATPVVVVCDADVACHPANLRRAIRLAEGEADVVLPYDGRFLDVPEPLIPRLLGDPQRFPGEKECRLLYPDGTGGMVFFKKACLLAAGLYNERFKSWGHEDRELLHRLAVFGHPVRRVAGPMLHLHHPRFADSHPMKNPHFAANCREYDRIRALAPEALAAEAAAFPWLAETNPPLFPENGAPCP